MRAPEDMPESFWRISIAWVLLAASVGAWYQFMDQPMAYDNHQGIIEKAFYVVFFGLICTGLGAAIIEGLAYAFIAGVWFVFFGSGAQRESTNEDLKDDTGLRSGRSFISEARSEAWRQTAPVMIATLSLAGVVVHYLLSK